VRKGDRTRREALDDFLVRHSHEIRRLLDEFHVPRVTSEGGR